MKKVLIAMLALAVLFGFAACDNSSSTPAGGDDATSSALINVETLQNIAKEINGLLTGNTYGVKALIGSEQKAEQVVDGSFVVTKSDQGNPTLLINPTSVTLTINSVKQEGEVTTTYYLNDFVYEFSTNVMAGGNPAVVSGTLKGYVTDSSNKALKMEVSTVDETTNVSINTTSAAVVVLEKDSLSDIVVKTDSAEEKASADDIAYLYNYLIAGGTDAELKWTDPTLYSATYQDLYEAQQEIVEGYAKLLITTAASDSKDIFTLIAGVKTSDQLTREVTVADKVATVKFANGTNEAYTIAGDVASGTGLQIPAGGVVTLTITGDSSANGTLTLGTAPTFAIATSKPLSVAKTVDSKVTEIATLSLENVTGTMTSASWKITDAEAADEFTVTTVGTLKIAEDSSFTVPNLPVGPAVVATETGVEYKAEDVVYTAPEAGLTVTI